MTTLKSLKQPNCIYEEEGHSYIGLTDGKLWAGVSSVAELVSDPKEKTGALMGWVAKLAGEHLEKNLLPETAYCQSEIDEIIKGAKSAYKTAGKEAQDIGTDTHEELENYIRAKIKNEEYSVKSNNPFISSALSLFIEKTKYWKWIASELFVGRDDIEVAGRLDALARINGVTTLIDFKVANRISPNYLIQTAGYVSCLEWMGMGVQERMIIRIPKTENLKIWDSKKRQYNEIPNELEFKKVETPYEWDKKVFENCRETYKWINANK